MKRTALTAVSIALLLVSLSSCYSPNKKEINDHYITGLKENVRFLRATLELERQQDSLRTALNVIRNQPFASNTNAE